MNIVPEHKECRKCGNRIPDKYIYCKPCYLEFQQWLKQADRIVTTHEQARENDFYGYEDKPAVNGEPKKTPKAL